MDILCIVFSVFLQPEADILSVHSLFEAHFTFLYNLMNVCVNATRQPLCEMSNKYQDVCRKGCERTFFFSFQNIF